MSFYLFRIILFSVSVFLVTKERLRLRRRRFFLSLSSFPLRLFRCSFPMSSHAAATAVDITAAAEKQVVVVVVGVIIAAFGDRTSIEANRHRWGREIGIIRLSKYLSNSFESQRRRRRDRNLRVVGKSTKPVAATVVINIIAAIWRRKSHPKLTSLSWQQHLVKVTFNFFFAVPLEFEAVKSYV